MGKIRSTESYNGFGEQKESCNSRLVCSLGSLSLIRATEVSEVLTETSKCMHASRLY